MYTNIQMLTNTALLGGIDQTNKPIHHGGKA